MTLKQISNRSISKAIAGIDELIQKLEDGSLLGSRPDTAIETTLLADATTSGHQEAVPKQKKKKEKKAQPAPSKPKKGGTDVKDNIQKAYLVVAKVKSVEVHPESDKLLLTTLDVGHEERQVVAGLQKHVSIDEFKGSLVVTIINLKTARLAGYPSEGMILASSSHVEGGEKVAPLEPPEGAQPGDMLFPEGFDPPEDASLCPKALKGDVWRGIVAKLCVQGGVATYDGKPLCTQKGQIICSGFPDGATIS